MLIFIIKKSRVNVAVCYSVFNICYGPRELGNINVLGECVLLNCVSFAGCPLGIDRDAI